MIPPKPVDRGYMGLRVRECQGVGGNQHQISRHVKVTHVLLDGILVRFLFRQLVARLNIAHLVFPLYCAGIQLIFESSTVNSDRS
jgi:hypothetical protein